jgi:hypothetical protein
MVMLDSKSEGQAQSSAPSQQQAPANDAPANDAPYDDDIPF